MWKKYRSKVSSYKLLLIFFLVGIVFSSLCFAQEEQVAKGLYYRLQVIVGLLSWVWILFANLAGKFMTNSAIYGSFLHLDKFFITWWDLMRNIANFSLFFVLLYKILSSIIRGDTVWMKKILSKILVAGILIQASWFLIGAILDISNIVTSALWTIPAQVISSAPSVESHTTKVYNEVLKSKVQFNINWKDQENRGTARELTSTTTLSDQERKEVIDSLLPTYQSLSWPLLFLGISILNIQDMSYQEHSEYTFSDLFTDLSIDVLILFIFSLALLLLFIFNFLRIFVLWIIIPLSPILIIFYILGIKNNKIQPFLNLSNIIKLIFMPAIFVTYLSIILLFIMSVKSLLTHHSSFSDNQSGISLTNTSHWKTTHGDVYDSTIAADGIFNLTMYGVKNTMADLFLYFFTLFLMRKMVMMMFTTKTGFGMIDNTMKTITKSATNLAWWIGVIPIPGWGTISARGLSKWWDKIRDNGIAAVNAKQLEQDERLQRLWWGTTSRETAERLAQGNDVQAFLKSDAVHSTIATEMKTASSNTILGSSIAMSFLRKHSGEDFKSLDSVKQFLNKNTLVGWKTYKEIIDELWFDPWSLEYKKLPSTPKKSSWWSPSSWDDQGQGTNP